MSSLRSFVLVGLGVWVCQGGDLKFFYTLRTASKQIALKSSSRMLIISGLGSLKMEDHQLEASLNYIVSCC